MRARIPAQFVPRHVQQAGTGPDAVIGFALVEFMEQHRLDRTAEAARGDLGHLGRAVGRAHGKSLGQHLGRMIAGAAAEFEDRAPGGSSAEKARQPR